ncbi:MAG TPA: aminopeptidase [Chloroflexota bacterium]|nr:aminopeptidase [Chloroflexota bacterium]
MAETMSGVAARMLSSCMGLREGESLLVVTDEPTREIGEALFEGGARLGARSMLLLMPPTGRHGAEPPEAVAEAMKRVDVAVCPTKFSITHTQARLSAAKAGVRIATMPGITRDMFFEGAISADYDAVAEITQRLTALLTQAAEARLVKGGKEMIISIQGRAGVPSTGLYREKGQSGNLPSGEAYIAPVEGSANGETIIDGAIAGIGKLSEPVQVTVRNGLLVDARGPIGKQLLAALDESPQGRNLAELGIGTNDRARLTGVILEDEKVGGTVHLAFGDNSTFGGNTRAGVHIDGIILNPELYLDGRLVVSGGKVLI